MVAKLVSSAKQVGLTVNH